MKSYSKTRTIQSLTRDIKKNKIVLDSMCLSSQSAFILADSFFQN